MGPCFESVHTTLTIISTKEIAPNRAHEFLAPKRTMGTRLRPAAQPPQLEGARTQSADREVQTTKDNTEQFANWNPFPTLLSSTG